MTTEKLAIDGGAPVRTKPFGAAHIWGDEDIRQVTEVIKMAPENWSSGFKVQAFEDAVAKRHGVKYALSTDSGSGAIHSAVGAYDFEPGDEIITTPVTDIGTVQGIMLQNLIPVFADWDADTLNTDPADIERKITDRTRAILAVHLFGNPCDMDEILDIASRHNLPVIEDCSQAHLAEYKGRLVGTMGDMGCYSMGGKLLSLGAGGMIITDNDQLARRAKGHSRKGSEYDDDLLTSLRPTSEGGGTEKGYSFLGDFHPMNDLTAALGLAQFQRWDGYREMRGRSAAILDGELYEVPGIEHQFAREGDVVSYWVYPYRIDEEVLGVSCEQFVEAVKAEGIDLCHGPYIKGMPLYKYPIFAEERTYGTSRYPFVDENGNRRVDYKSLELPVIDRELPKVGWVSFRSGFTEEDVRDIGAAMRKVALHYASRR